MLRVMEDTTLVEKIYLEDNPSPPPSWKVCFITPKKNIDEIVISSVPIVFLASSNNLENMLDLYVCEFKSELFFVAFEDCIPFS